MGLRSNHSGAASRAGQLVGLIVVSAVVFLAWFAGTSGARPLTLRASGTETTPETVNEQTCLQDGLAPHPDAKVEMKYPGNRHQQAVISVIPYIGMTECDGIAQRSAFIKLQVQNYLHHAKWITFTVPKWVNIYVNNTADPLAGPSQQLTGHEPDDWFFHKTPGPSRTHVREFLKTVVRSASGAILGQRVEKIPVTIDAPASKQ